MVIIRILVIVCLAASAAAAQERFVANLSAAQVVPATVSAASAICRGTLNAARTQVDFQCSFSGLSAAIQATRVHVGAPVGQNIAPVFGASAGGGTSGTVNFGFAVGNPQTLADLRANRWYLTMTNAAFPDGEIRGQVHRTNSAYNDFDGDGRTDLTVYRNSVNAFFALGSADGAFREQPIGAPGDSVSLTVDFDGDGRSDFSTARYNAEVLWRIRGSATNTLTETRWGSSALGDFFAAADYDGDGRFDIAVFRAGVWHIIESSTGNFRYEFFGQSGDAPAPNDFDSDGRADLVAARSESGQRVWHVRRSSDGVYFSFVWGLSSDGFFTGRADWDGDGLQDITVIRNESGQRVFYIRRSSDNSLQVVRWGLSSDVVKLGDYDGDGRTDAAVTRAVSGQRVFFILQSSDGAPRYETFGLQGDF